ncbi:MAG: hypothetical protein ACOX3K_01375 [Bacilli bacterium]|jgi:hypothetical protein
MKEFFRKIGQGILGIVTLPFFIGLLAIGLVAGVIVFLVYLVIIIVRFFRGYDLFPMSEREEKAGEMLRAKAAAKAAEAQAPGTPPTPMPFPYPTPQVIIIQTGTDQSGNPIFSPVTNPQYQTIVEAVPTQGIAQQENTAPKELIDQDVE